MKIVRPRLKKEEIENSFAQNRCTFERIFPIDFFARIGRSDLTKKLEKVGPFECDELEKHCRVSAKCYPTKFPVLYTQKKMSTPFFFLCFLFALQSKSQLLVISFTR